MARNQLFSAFNGSNPLLLAKRNDISYFLLKVSLFFTSETLTCPIEHIQEVSSVCNIHNVIEDDVAIELLVACFKGKALQWYKSLPHNSITSWDELGGKSCKHFEDKSDLFSLLEQLTTIKRAPHECMTIFNYRFQRTWDRILVAMRPTPSNAFLHYLNDFDNNITIALQFMRGDTLPATYDMAIRADNILIQVGSLAPRPLIPLFPDMPTQQPTTPPFPTTSTSQSFIALDASTSISEVGKLRGMLHVLAQRLDKKLQDQGLEMQVLGNEIINLEKQQVQNIMSYVLHFQRHQPSKPMHRGQASWPQIAPTMVFSTSLKIVIE